MKKLFVSAVVCLAGFIAPAQYIYKIKADSILLTNDSCNAELNLENSTRNVCGFLFNKGNGRTEFRRGLIKLNDSTYIIGCDTLRLHGGGGGGGGSITADNGLTANTATNVQLGGTGIQNTNIDWANFTWTNTWDTLAGNSGLKLTSTSTAAASSTQKVLEISLSGTNTNSSQSTYGIYSANTHTGTLSANYGIAGVASGGSAINVGVYGVGSTYAVYGDGLIGGGTGVYGTSPSGTNTTGVKGESPSTFGQGVFGFASGSGSSNKGVNGSSTNGIGVNGEGGAFGVRGYSVGIGGVFISDTGTPLVASAIASSTSTEQTGLKIERDYQTSSAASNGLGSSIDYYARTTSGGTGSASLANQIISKWTDATTATRTSQFIITGVNSAATADLFTLSGSGATKLNKYGTGTFTGTAAYNLAVDASGNVIEATGVSSAHNILSSTHSDAVTASVVRGDLMIGNSTPKWARLALGSVGTHLTSDGTDVTWKSTTSSQSTPADQNGISSTTGLMVGLAGSITPAYSGKIMIIISGDIKNSTNGDGGKIQIRYGTGTAPANQGTVTGTAAGGFVNFNNANPSTANIQAPWSLNAIVSGLTVGTAYWVDVDLAAITGGTVSIKNVSISIVEL